MCLKRLRARYPRSVVAGSVDAARRAGPRHAPRDATTRTAGATVKATASSGVTPNSRSCMRRVKTLAPSTPSAMPAKRHRQTFAQHETHEIDAPRTERRTNRELANALRHAVGQHAIQSDRGQHHRDAREAGHHGSREPGRIERCGHGRRQRLDPIDHGLAFDARARAPRTSCASAAGLPVVRITRFTCPSMRWPCDPWTKYSSG